MSMNMEMENQYKPEGELCVLVNLLKQGGKQSNASFFFYLQPISLISKALWPAPLPFCAISAGSGLTCGPTRARGSRNYYSPMEFRTREIKDLEPLNCQ